jgi:hypothetical protein
LINQEVEGVKSTQDVVIGAVEVGPLLPQLVELLHTALGALLQLSDRPELDGAGGTCLGACGLQAALQAVVAQRTLFGGIRGGVDVDDAKRARPDAISAAVTDIGLDHHGVEFGADDGAGRTDFEAACLDAMLTHVAHHQPAADGTIFAKLLDEFDVAPVDAIQALRIVITIAAELAHAAVGGGKLIPFLAGDLARLAPDAHGGIGIKPHGLRHHAFSTLHTKALPSWMDTFGSPTNDVSSFTASPVTIPW